MNGHEFHDRPPVSTLMMEMGGRRIRERERKRGATVDPILSPVYTQFVSSHADTFIFLRDMLVKWPTRYIIIIFIIIIVAIIREFSFWRFKRNKLPVLAVNRSSSRHSFSLSLFLLSIFDRSILKREAAREANLILILYFDF